MESFFGVMKNEMFYGGKSQFETFDDLKRQSPNTSGATTAEDQEEVELDASEEIQGDIQGD